MTLAHISDTHIGYYAYGKTMNGTVNQREYDVLQVFKECLDAILARDPDFILHTGDFFHQVRPSNRSLIAAYKLLTRVQTMRKGKPFVIIAGNHDTPRSTDQQNILHLFADIPGVHVETGSARSLEIGDVEVMCVPNNSVLSRENVSQSPSLGKKLSFKLVHGLAKETEFEETHFELAEMRPDDWTYVALGDFHIHSAYRRNVCYSGSTEFTSTNIWEESSRQKGWVWFDTEVGQLEFVPCLPRSIVDLPVIDASELSAELLADELRGRAKWNAGDLPIVRQVVANVLPEVRRGLGIQVRRELEAKCLYYKLELRQPAEALRFGEGVIEAQTLEASWVKHIDAKPLPGGVKRDELKTLGLEILKEVSEHEADPVEA